VSAYRIPLLRHAIDQARENAATSIVPAWAAEYAALADLLERELAEIVGAENHQEAA
jgi:hypothetical protein